MGTYDYTPHEEELMKAMANEKTRLIQVFTLLEGHFVYIDPDDSNEILARTIAIIELGASVAAKYFMTEHFIDHDCERHDELLDAMNDLWIEKYKETIRILCSGIDVVSPYDNFQSETNRKLYEEIMEKINGKDS